MTRFATPPWVKYSKTWVTSGQRGVAERGQLGVEGLLAGEGDEGDAAGLALAGEALEAVGEIGTAAEDADDHGAGLGQVVGDEAVEGLGVLELVGVAGADGGEVVGEAADGRGEGLDLGVGGRQDDEHGSTSPSGRGLVPVDAPGGHAPRGRKARVEVSGKAGEGGAGVPTEEPPATRLGPRNPSTALPSKATEEPICPGPVFWLVGLRGSRPSHPRVRGQWP